jgi:hypothetical protein
MEKCRLSSAKKSKSDKIFRKKYVYQFKTSTVQPGLSAVKAFDVKRRQALKPI